jgi:pilus assembly protein CpaE
VYQLDAILIGCHDDVACHLRRELERNGASIEAECRDVGETLSMLGPSRAKKRLLILELNPLDGLLALRQLWDAMPTWPVMVLIDSQGDDRAFLTSSLINAVQTGASQIVGLPVHSQDFKTALDRLGAQFVNAPDDRTKVIAVAGVTGGCGATSLAINLGQEISFLWNKRCILVDLSLKLGAVAPHLNIETAHSINDLLGDMTRIDETLICKALYKIADNYELLAGPDRLVALFNHTSSDVNRLLELTKPLCDVILLDLPCTYDDFYFELLTGASQMVLVGEQKVPSIRALKLVREMVGRDASPELEHLVINRFDKQSSSLSVPLLSRILGVKRLHTIGQDEPAFTSASNRGCTLRSSAPRSQALAEIDVLATELIGRDEGQHDRPRVNSLVSRLIHTLA